MAHESANTLKTNLQNAFGLPDHVWQTFHAWIDSVEERLGGGSSRTPLNREGDENVSGTQEEQQPQNPGAGDEGSGEGEGQLQPEPGADQPQPNPDQAA